MESPSSDLPIVPHLPDIAKRLGEAGLLVLQAEPGAGKTTMVPAFLATQPRFSKKILLLVPRRVAAIQAASRLAELAGEELGGTFGYRVRGEARIGRGTRVEAITEGLLVRMLQEDPGLQGVDLVIFDEFHERSLQAELGLALLREVRAELRPDIGLLLMSATLEAGELASRLGGVCLAVPGRSHPIETRYATPDSERNFERDLATLALELARDAQGDVLVFLPGAREIETCARFLEDSDFELRRLHGSLPLREQRLVLLPPPGAPRRIILATSLAETSLTVPRVDAVLDSGLARLSRFEVRSGMNRLVTEREAQDRADQRRGRAGRLGPGLCLRAWPRSEVLPARTEPEILRAELSATALEAALWGARKPEDLPWLTPPPGAAWSAARELLAELGALDGGGGPTDFGRAMARLGTEPRLAALALRGIEAGEGELALRLAALLGEDHRNGGKAGNDLQAGIDGLLSGDPRFSSARRELRRLRSATEIVGSLFAQDTEDAEKAGGGAEPPKSLGANNFGATLGGLLSRAFPDRVAKRTESLMGKNGEREARFRLPGGRMLRAGGVLAESAWIVAAEADAGREEGRVFSGSAIAEAEAVKALEPMIETENVLTWEGMAYKTRRRRSAGAILLSETPMGALPREELVRALGDRLRREGLGILPWDRAARDFLDRLRWYGATRDDPRFPDFSESGLVAEFEDWLAPFVEAEPEAVLAPAGLLRALEARLSYRLRTELDREAPERLTLPSGSSRPIRYGEGPEPVVEARVQEFFGLAVHPTVCGHPLVLRLLTPAGRPLQISADLPGFWRGAWAEARRELRGRYPKHEWPEDPSSALPSRSGLKKRK